MQAREEEEGTQREGGILLVKRANIDLGKRKKRRAAHTRGRKGARNSRQVLARRVGVTMITRIEEERGGGTSGRGS